MVPYTPIVISPPTRCRVAELMDSPSIGQAEHLAALQGLARLNGLSMSGRSLWREINAFVRLHKTGISVSSPLTILDVATGSGDIPQKLARWASRSALPIAWSVCDKSPRAVAQATEALAQTGHTCEGFVCDLLADRLPGQFDIVICSLFLHHLDPPDVARALSAMAGATTGRLLINDLRRTRRGLCLAHVMPRLCTRSPVVWFDAVASVRAAYTPAELLECAHNAGLASALVEPDWPQRMLLSWSPLP